MGYTNFLKYRRSFGAVRNKITDDLYTDGIHITYTSTQSPFKGGKIVEEWSPNHFLPLLRKVVNASITGIIDDNVSQVTDSATNNIV